MTVYTPPGYPNKEKVYGLLLVFDEQWYLSRIPTPTILNNLQNDGKIPPLIAVFVDNGPGNARYVQLPGNPQFADFIADELIPWLHSQYNICDKPERTIIAGASYGGLAATYISLRHPEIFGNVLSQSGSYWWPGPSESDRLTDSYSSSNFITSLVIDSPKQAVRFYLDAGSGELDMTGNGGDVLIPNRHLGDVLRAKGYEVHYREFVGGHDFLSWRGTFADGLIILTEAWENP